MLALCDARLGDVDAHLPTVLRPQEFRETAPGIHIHLQGESDLLFRKVGQISGIQFLGKRMRGNLRHDERGGLPGKGMQQIHNLAQRHLMGHRSRAISSILLQDCFHAIEFATMFLAFQSRNHLLHQVVYIQKFQSGRRIVHLKRQIMGGIVTEGGHGTVVIRTAPLPEKVRETIDQHFRPGLAGICKEQFLPGQFGPAIVRSCITAYQSGLDGTGQHHRAYVTMLLQRLQ